MSDQNNWYHHQVLNLKDAPFSGDAGIFDEMEQLSLPRVINVIKQPEMVRNLNYQFPSLPYVKLTLV